ncbi:MAG: LytTR family DNA-binding domain-containing protein, partial [Saprospiraceae bacterium]
AFEETMVNLGFVRVHKSHIVNMNYMKTYVKGEGGYLVLESGETVEVARRKKSTLIDAVRRGQGNF